MTAMTSLAGRELRIVFMGPPACGKGTQAAVLAEYLGLPVVVTGEMLRRAAVEGTPGGLAAKQYMDQGLLVPDSVLFQLVEETLRQPQYDGGALLDGYPRTIAQAEFLDGLLAKQGRAITHVLYLSVPDEVLIRRQAGRLICRSCGKVYNRYSLPPAVEGQCECGGELYQRSDDSEETIRRRLQVYLDSTAPLIDFYRQRGLLHEVDGVGDPAVVQERILAATDIRQAREA
jgi:adenylate kinase